MPPNMGRFLPVILIAVVLLIVLPTVLKKKSSAAGSSSGARATKTIDATNLIDAGEQGYRAAHGGYTSHLADLVSIEHRLASDFVIGLAVQLDVGSDKQSFFATVESDVLSLVRARSGKKLIAGSCLILKSGSGVACPASST